MMKRSKRSSKEPKDWFLPHLFKQKVYTDRLAADVQLDNPGQLRWLSSNTGFFLFQLFKARHFLFQLILTCNSAIKPIWIDFLLFKCEKRINKEMKTKQKKAAVYLPQAHQLGHVKKAAVCHMLINYNTWWRDPRLDRWKDLNRKIRIWKIQELRIALII